MTTADRQRSGSGRREPPRFREAALQARTRLSPRMISVVLGGPGLSGFVVDQPAASIRLLLPKPDSDELVIPQWNGNEFLLDDGSRPIIRTFTPRRFDPEGFQLELLMVIHEGGLASAWAVAAPIGAPAAVSGPGRGYTPEPDASGFVLVGDETAIPAIAQLLEAIPEPVPVRVHIEVATDAARLELPQHPHASVEWHPLSRGQSPGDTLIAAVRGIDFDEDDRLWCAGEAAAMHAVRRHVFEDRGMARSQTTIRGYWKARR